MSARETILAEKIACVLVAVEPYLEKLAAFDDPEDIRRFLVAEGVRAAVGGPRSCAIAEYVARGSGHRIAIGGTNAYDWFHDGIDPSLFRTHIFGEHTQAMKEFVWNFDEGAYPELVP